MQKQKQTKLSEMPIMALAVTIIVMIGALLGVLYYFAANFNEFIIKEKSTIDSKCNQKVKGIGSCEMAIRGYEFDSESGRCVKKTVSGCSAEMPFNSLEKCQKTCEKEAVTDKELKFETIDDADWVGVGEKKNYIIKSKKEWQDVWAKAGHSVVAPEVDFTKEMIIAVFYGVALTGGYSVEIIKVIEGLDKLTVFIKETSPGSDCTATQALTEPRHIIKVQRVDKEVVFNVASEVKNCFEEDICDVGKREWDEIEGIFTENNPEFSRIKSECEGKSECQWQSLGGKIVSHYACCPKDFSAIMSENEIKIWRKCGLQID